LPKHCKELFKDNLLISSLGRRLRDRLIASFPIELRSAGGIKLRLYNRSEIRLYNRIFVEGIYPAREFKHVLEAIANPVIFDVGANNGQFCAFALDHWPQAQIHAFEPQPALVRRIREMAALNQIENRIVINETAISNTCGQQTLYENNNPVSASLLQDKAAKRAVRRQISVPVTTLDEYSKRGGIEKIDVLKLDIEGAEIQALQGASEVLKTVKLVFIEFHPPFATFTQGAELLHNAGFRCAWPSPPPGDDAQDNCVFVRAD
jgi:FkbM family methyltransferase